MSIKKFILAALVSSAFLAFPLVASANNYFIKGTVTGPATATFSDITGVTSAKITRKVITFYNGTIVNDEATDFLRDDGNTPAHKLELSNLAVLYSGVKGTTKDAQFRFWTPLDTFMIRTGSGTAAGIGTWEIEYPTEDSAALNATTNGKQYYMSGYCRLRFAVDATLRGILQANEMVPEEAGYYPYTSDGVGNVVWGDFVPTDGNLVSIPDINIKMILAP